MGLTSQIAAFAADTDSKRIPAEAIAAAKRAFIDTLGVALAGRREPAVEAMSRVLADGDEAFALPGDRRLAAADAALLGGLAGHVLDYDDVAQAGHPSVVLVPAILAEAQRLNSGGKAALGAYAVGFEVWAELACREPDAYHLGSWHPTPMLGIIAATAALCSLQRQNSETTRHALAIAASLASGVIANFGTPMKPLQAGRAAANALEAARLASAGLWGSADAIENPHGLLRGISPKGQVDTESEAVLPIEPWQLVGQGLSVKRYPVCYAAHRAIDAVIALAQDAGLSPAEVRSVTVRLGRAPAETLRYHHPMDGLEARFSLHHNIAAALTDRAVGFAQLGDDYVRRPDIAALYTLTRLEIDDSDPCPEQPGLAKFDHVVIATSDGRALDSGPIRYPKGHARRPLDDRELADKFLDCARHGGHADPEGLLGRLVRLDDMASVRELFA
jgi:2-methylcitrate dehydratase PrpD